MFFGTSARLPKPDEVYLNINGAEIEHVTCYRYLDVTLDSRLTFSKHVEQIRQKSIPTIKTLGRISHFVNKERTLYLYQSLVMSHIEYADIIYDSLSQADAKYLQRI